MTFALTLFEHLDALHTRSQAPKGAEKKVAMFPLTIAIGTACLALWLRDWHFLLLTPVWLLLPCFFACLPQLNAAQFRWRHGGEAPPLQTVRFEKEGVTFPWLNVERTVPWNRLSKPLEGELVWIFVSRLDGHLLFSIPKRILLTPEGAREWAFAENHFAPTPFAPPLVSP